jgi:hypothetical protein
MRLLIEKSSPVSHYFHLDPSISPQTPLIYVFPSGRGMKLHNRTKTTHNCSVNINLYVSRLEAERRKDSEEKNGRHSWN